jgi:pyruvate/2-oxoacid:ferredoxin oxidoreductase alpha subunit
VDKFLPPFKATDKLDTAKPQTFNPLCTPENYMEFRYIMEKAHQRTIAAYLEICQDFAKRFGRSYEIVELTCHEDADTLLVTSGSMTSTARVAVKELRKKGEKVGICKLRMFRPFPLDAIREALCNLGGGKKIAKIAVLDRNISHGSGGIWANEIKAAFYAMPNAPLVYTFHLGLGGRDITPETIKEAYEHTKKTDKPGDTVWIGLKA